MNIPLIKPYFNRDEARAVAKVLESGWVMQGPVVEKFEKAIADYIGVPYAVAVSSGTAALHLSLLALGIKPGDEVIVPSLSFIASANCVLYVGARPVFADIDEKTYNLDSQDVETKITKRTKAIIAVHQIGLSADIETLTRLCQKHNLYLIEDAACALGATYQGQKVGSFGKVACFSFHPRKSITTGEGGIITTKDERLSYKLKSLRSHGVVKSGSQEEYPYLGYNYRLTDLQAAVGLVQLVKLDSILRRRRFLAQRYDHALGQISGITIPYVPHGLTHTYQSYMIRTPRRNQLAAYLQKQGIATRPGIMMIHKEPLYKRLLGKVSLPATTAAARDSLILPLYPTMTKEEQDAVIGHLKTFCSHRLQ